MEGLNGQPLKRKSLLQMRYPNRKGGARCRIDLVAAGLIKDPVLTAEKETKNDKDDRTDDTEGKENLQKSRGPSLLQLRYPKRKGGFRCRYDLDAIGLINVQSVSKRLQSATEDVQLEKMSASPCKGAAAAAAGEDYDTYFITSLIQERRKSFEENKLTRRVEWKASSKKEVEERAVFESEMVYLPDLAWRKVFEYVEDSKDKKKLICMTELWRNLMLNERTQFLFPFVLPILVKTDFIKLEDAFHCRLVCKIWKDSFDACLQGANKIDANANEKRNESWSTLSENATHFPTSVQQQAAFLLRFPPLEQNPFLISRSLKLDAIPRESDAFPLIWEMAMEIDSLFLDLDGYCPPNPAPTTANWQSLKHLGMANLPVFCNPDMITQYDILIRRGIPADAAVESLALYDLCQLRSDNLLRRIRSTLKTLLVKQTGWVHFGHDVIANPIENIEYYGPFPELRALSLQSMSGCPEIPVECKDYVPSLEKMHWECLFSTFTDVSASFRCVNLIGSSLRHLRLSFGNRNDAYHETEDLPRLHLPQLETLDLNFQCFGLENIDFLLPCECLREFNLTFCKPLHSDSEKRSEEIIDFIGFEKRMYESNIWEIFPDLRRLRISIIPTTTYRDFERFYVSHKKESKVYTRSGLEKYRGNKNYL